MLRFDSEAFVGVEMMKQWGQRMATCKPIDVFRSLFVDVPEPQQWHQPRTVAPTNTPRRRHKLQNNHKHS